MKNRKKILKLIAELAKIPPKEMFEAIDWNAFFEDKLKLEKKK